MQLTELERPIFDIVPHIFKRPLLSVSPSDSLLQVATFLAIGPQIYVDAVVVLDNRKFEGVVGGRHIIEYTVNHPRAWLQGSASTVMNRSADTVQADLPLRAALDIFENTGFAFVPVTIKQDVATSLSIRDVLRVAIASKLETPVAKLSSPIVAVEAHTTIGESLELMLEQGIRNLMVQDKSKTGVINDRMILEYFLGHECREMVSSQGLDGLFKVPISILDITAVKSVDQSVAASLAAELLLDVGTPCLQCGDSIVTPWDIVMKGMLHGK
jgi:predicted transcriptional regulator